MLGCNPVAFMFPDAVFLVVIPGPLTVTDVGLFVVPHTTLIALELMAVAVISPSAATTGGGGGGGAAKVGMSAISTVVLPIRLPIVTFNTQVRAELPEGALLLPPENE